MRALLTFVVLFGCVATRPLAARGFAREPPLPPCIHFWSEARYRPFGYDHVVHIRSACSADARCKVTTDVNPEVLDATVPAHGEVEVITQVGSPAREFTAEVACRLAQ
jgi:hypothetical protein